MTVLTTAAQIAAEIKARLSAITINEGAETDIGSRIFMGRAKIGDDELPCISVIEGQDDPTDQPGRLPAVVLNQLYVINAYLECDADNPNDAAHAAIRDIKRAIYKDGSTFGEKVSKVTYRGRDIGPRPDGAAVVQAQVMISIKYAETLANP